MSMGETYLEELRQQIEKPHAMMTHTEYLMTMGRMILELDKRLAKIERWIGRTEAE